MRRFGWRELQRVTITWSSTTMTAFVDMMKPDCDSRTPKCSLAYAGISIHTRGDGIVAITMMMQKTRNRRSRRTGP